MKIACSSNCLTCSSLAACLTCPPGNALVSSTCTPCSAGTYPLSSSSASCAGGYLCSFYNFANDSVACSSGCAFRARVLQYVFRARQIITSQLWSVQLVHQENMPLTGTSTSCTGCKNINNYSITNLNISMLNRLLNMY